MSPGTPVISPAARGTLINGAAIPFIGQHCGGLVAAVRDLSRLLTDQPPIFSPKSASAKPSSRPLDGQLAHRCEGMIRMRVEQADELKILEVVHAPQRDGPLPGDQHRQRMCPG